MSEQMHGFRLKCSQEYSKNRKKNKDKIMHVYGNRKKCKFPVTVPRCHGYGFNIKRQLNIASSYVGIFSIVM